MIFVNGKVQGVGFRKYTLRKAKHYQILGWVRNLEDGSVEIDAQGTGDAMHQFIGDILKGPKRSKVEKLECYPQSMLMPYKKFMIKK